MIVLLDSNIILRFVEPGHSQHAVSASAVRRLRDARHEIAIVPQVLYQFCAQHFARYSSIVVLNPFNVSDGVVPQ